MSLKTRIKSLFSRSCDFVKRKPRQALLIFLVFLALFIFGNIQLLHYTSNPQFCEICHPDKGTGPLTEVYTWRKSVHAKDGVECLDCHGKPGFFGYMRAKIGGLEDVYGQLFRSRERRIAIMKEAAQPAYAARLVPNETCLFCHNDSANEKIRKERLMSVGVKFRKLDGVVNPGFRKQYGLTDIMVGDVGPDASVVPGHAKHLGEGLNCTDCHLGVAHGGEARNLPKMQTCFDCHDRIRAEKKNPPTNQNCTACHRDFARIAPQAAITYKPKDADPVSFSHSRHLSKAKCADCHTSIWPMKRGVVKMKMDDMYAGKYCATCHNGEKAFGVMDCGKCHIEKKKAAGGKP